MVDGATNPPLMEDPSQVVEAFGNRPVQFFTSPPAMSCTSRDQVSRCATAELALMVRVTGPATPLSVGVNWGGSRAIVPGWRCNIQHETRALHRDRLELRGVFNGKLCGVLSLRRHGAGVTLAVPGEARRQVGRIALPGLHRICPACHLDLPGLDGLAVSVEQRNLDAVLAGGSGGGESRLLHFHRARGRGDELRFCGLACQDRHEGEHGNAGSSQEMTLHFDLLRVGPVISKNERERAYAHTRLSM